MKPLYFSATVRSRIAAALSTQVYESLRPYDLYLKSAIQAAKKRETKSVCRWEPIPREYMIQLEPIDTLLCIESIGYSYLVEGWEGDAPDIPLFVGQMYRPVEAQNTLKTKDGLVVSLAEELDREEQVFWAGRACTLRSIPPVWPKEFRGEQANGAPVRVLRRKETATQLLLVVEGVQPSQWTDNTGNPVDFTVLEAHEGATQLRGHKTLFSWTGQRNHTLFELPDTDTLCADNGVRWKWTEAQRRGRRRTGVWVQLLASDEGDDEATIDPRAIYCEEGVREVRTKRGGGQKNTYKVWGFRRDNYQVELDRLPPEGSTLYLPSNTSGLYRQREVIRRLQDSPLPHQRSLLTLCEDPRRVRWSRMVSTQVAHWYLLAEDYWNGTEQQREFVLKALGTPDFAFLEGPPGSGKTHAICELILQLIDAGKRVLLCSTTHVAVDNVLDRLAGKYEQVEAVRIGQSNRVDPRVRNTQIDERINDLTQTWREAGLFSQLDDNALERTAQATILASVNLTCGTSTGILAHPYIRRGTGRDDDTGPCWPYFDVLIIDEASKTTFQEFLVPAQLASRWIVVGDIRQLPPFSEPKDLEASIAEVSDEKEKEFSNAYQKALLLLFRLQRHDAGRGKVQWIIEEPNEVLEAIKAEVAARGTNGAQTLELIMIVDRKPSMREVSVRELEKGEPAALMLMAADWILFPPELRERISRFLPASATPLKELEPGSAWAFRFSRWHKYCGRFDKPVKERRKSYKTALELAQAQRDFFQEESWAKQVAWRMSRVHQLSNAQSGRQRERRQEEVEELLPVAQPFVNWVPPGIDAIRDVGVRSVIETLQESRARHRARRLSALTEAIPSDVWKERAVLLSFQHRMHPEISVLPRKLFYQNEALLDANTLNDRDKNIGWAFRPDLPARRIWIDVHGVVSRGINQKEIDAMRQWLEEWKLYASQHRRTDGLHWEVACLSFYNRQELGIRDMLRQVTGQSRAETRFELPNTTVSCATVDRFQGREADLVLLSLRNPDRPGHMDSPNRLNVGITRARCQIIIFGHHRYFSENCPSEELSALAKETHRFPLRRHS